MAPFWCKVLFGATFCGRGPQNGTVTVALALKNGKVH